MKPNSTLPGVKGWLKMATSIEVPRRLPLLLVADNVLLPGSSMRIPVRSLRKLVSAWWICSSLLSNKTALILT